MMNQQKTKKAGILKYSLIVPLALALVLSSNTQTLLSLTHHVITGTDTTKSPKAIPSEAQRPIKSESKATAPLVKKDKQQAEKVYETVDSMPQYPNGANTLMSYIARNLKYPVEAQKKGIQGKVYIRFVVNSNGKVVNAVVAKSKMDKVKKTDTVIKTDEVVVVGYKNTQATEDNLKQDSKEMNLLEQEAIRVVNSLPNFTPGVIKGKKVSVYYLLPITYKLE